MSPSPSTGAGAHGIPISPAAPISSALSGICTDHQRLWACNLALAIIIFHAHVHILISASPMFPLAALSSDQASPANASFLSYRLRRRVRMSASSTVFRPCKAGALVWRMLTPQYSTSTQPSLTPASCPSSVFSTDTVVTRWHYLPAKTFTTLSSSRTPSSLVTMLRV